MPQSCPACGFENPDRAKFCNECGAALKMVREKRRGFRHVRTAERRHATVLFADIQGYTSLSAQLDPEELHEVMDPIYATMARAVTAHGGTVAKYIGDSVMALFGVPEAHEDDEARAIRCALELHRHMAEYPETGGRKLALTIGVNAGLVVAGDIGAAQKFDFDALGDTVNVAARLQGRAQAGQVFASDHVYRRARPQFDWEPVGPFELKNVPYLVSAYRVVGERDPMEVAKFVGAGMAKLCGREDEIDAISGMLKAVINGSGCVLGVRGEAGVGKSRLVYELRARAQDFGFRTLVGRTHSYGHNMPLMPIKEIVRLFAGLKEHEETRFARERILEAFSSCWAEAEIREIRVATLAWFLGYPIADSIIENLDGKAKQGLLEVSLNEFFAALTSGGVIGKPLVIVIEDMHWADGATRDWVIQFARLIRNKPILIVLVYRPGFKHDWSSEDLVTFSEITLAPIDTAAVGEMVSSILVVQETPAELARFVAQKSQGNPFYAEELLKHLLEEGVVTRRQLTSGEASAAVITKPLEEVDIPSSVQALILSRVDRLEHATRRTLQEASVVGRTFLKRILAEISSARDEFSVHLDRLRDLEMIFEQNRLPELQYAFHHVLARDAVYETLLKRERRQLHRAVAEAVERLLSERLEDFYCLLAHHVRLAGDIPRAVHFMHKEGRRLRDSGEFRAAHAILDEAVALAGEDHKEYVEIVINLAVITIQVKSTAAAREVLRRLPANLSAAQAAQREAVEGDILVGMSRFDEAQEKFESVQAAATGLGDYKLALDAARGLGVAHWRRGNLDQAERSLRTCIEIAEREGDRRGEAAALGNIALVYADRGDHERALEYQNKSLELRRAMGDRRSEAIILGNIGVIYRQRGDLDRAVQFHRESLQIRQALGDRRGQAIALGNVGVVHKERGDLDKGLECLRKCMEIFREVGNRAGESVALNNIGLIYAQQGDLDKGMEYLKKSLDIDRAVGNRYGETIASRDICALLLLRGQVVEAKERIEKTFQLASEVGARPLAAECQALLARAEHEAGNHDAAAVALESAMATFKEQGMSMELFSSFLDQVDQALDRANKLKAQECLALAEALLPEIEDSPSLRNYHLVRAKILGVLGEIEDAQSVFEETLEHAAGCAELMNHELYYEYGRFLFNNKKAPEISRGRVREILARAQKIYNYRVAHGARRRELDEINAMLDQIDKNSNPD